MVIYECNRCTKIYNDQSKYTKHINRKSPCLVKDSENQNNNSIKQNQELDNNMINNKSLENTDEINNSNQINEKVKVLSDLIDYLYKNREAVIKSYNKYKEEKNKD